MLSSRLLFRFLCLAAYFVCFLHSFQWAKLPVSRDSRVRLEWGAQVVGGPDWTTSETCSATPRAWLESLPDGVYTVIRCDLSPTGEWSVWGSDFHLNRLAEGYQRQKLPSPEAAISHTEKALNDTRIVLATLLDNAAKELPFLLDWTAGPSSCCSCVVVVMATILWTTSDIDSGIRVRGHLYSSSARVTDTALLSDPIKTVIALSFDARKPLPDRRSSDDPRIKSSSWCRRRRPLEEQFKNSDSSIGEVILSNQDGPVTTLLEGLTTNLCFVYPHHILRMCTHEVLDGYAQSLVRECAPELGYTISTAPVSIAESLLWQEVFVTSSVRIVTPVESVALPNKGETTTCNRIIWRRSNSNHPVASSIYAHIIRNKARWGKNF